MKRIAIAAISVLLCFAASTPAFAGQRSFTDPVGDGSGGMDIDRFNVAYTDHGGRIRIHFVDLRAANFNSIIWYVNQRGPGFGQAGIVVKPSGHIRDIGDQPCAAARVRLDRHADVASLWIPTSCVDDARRIRVMLGVEGGKAEDWNEGWFSAPVQR